MRPEITRWILFALGFLDFFAVAIIIPQIAVNFNNKNYSPFLYGLSGTAYGCIQTLSGPLFGGYSDIHGRKSSILITFYLTSGCYLCFVFIEHIVWFLAARSLLGIFKHSNTMCKSYLCDITPREQHSTIIGRFNAVSSCGFIVGPLIGGSTRNFETAAWIVSGIFFVSGVFAHVFLDDSRPSSVTDRKTKETKPNQSVIELCRGIDWPKYWDMFLVRLLFVLAVVLYRSNFSYLLASTHSLTAKEIGYVMSFSGTTAAISGFLAGPILRTVGKSSYQVHTYMGFIMTAGLLGMFVASSITQFVISMAFFTMSSSLSRVYGLDALLEIGTGKDVGLLQGVSQSVASVARGIAPLISGTLQQINQSLPALTAASLALIGAILSLLSMNRRLIKSD